MWVRDTETFKDHAVSSTFTFEGADCAILHHHNGTSLVKSSAARGGTMVLLRLGDQIEFFVTSDVTNDEYTEALRRVRAFTHNRLPFVAALQGPRRHRLNIERRSLS